MLQHQTLLRAAPIVAKIIGRKLNVNVVFKGRDAKTDGNTIVIPETRPDDPDASLLVYGYIGHEAAHVRFTDFSVLSKMQAATPLKHTILNVLEDARIEREMGAVYPGVRTDLQKLVEKLIANGDMLGPTNENSQAYKLQSYLLYRLRYEMLEQKAFGDLASTAESLFREAVTPALATRVGAVVTQAGSMKSTEDALQLTERILVLLKEATQESPPHDNSTNLPESVDADGACEATSRKAVEAMLAADKEDFAKDLGSLLQDKLQKMARSPEAGTTAGMAVAEPLSAKKGDGRTILAQAARATQALRRRLSGLLEAHSEGEESNVISGQILDPVRLTRVPFGAQDIFLQESDGVEIDTAVQILLDRSGSMEKNMMVAAEATLAIAMALQQIAGVNVAVAAFPSAVTDGVVPLTAFGETAKRTAGRYAAIKADGGTPLAEALWWGIDSLLQTKETRKLLLVITDGEPVNPDGVRDIVNLAAKSGFQMLGLGIGSDAVHEFFPTYSVVNTIHDLAPAMFKMLRTSLAQHRAR